MNLFRRCFVLAVQVHIQDTPQYISDISTCSMDVDCGRFHWIRHYHFPVCALLGHSRRVFCKVFIVYVFSLLHLTIMVTIILKLLCIQFIIKKNVVNGIDNDDIITMRLGQKIFFFSCIKQQKCLVTFFIILVFFLVCSCSVFGKSVHHRHHFF